ncbi:MAG: hypothetical protein WCI11_01475 [Candidatus Methylumidiphilus sp.]
MTSKNRNPVTTKSANNKSDIADSASIFASALQIVSIFVPFIGQGLLNLTASQAATLTLFSAMALAFIGLFIMWNSHGHPSTSNPYITFYVALFIAIILSAMLIYSKVNPVNNIEGKPTSNSSPIQEYSISIFAYKDNNGDSIMNGLDEPILNSSIIVHDAYTESHIGTTNREGKANILLPRTGKVEVEICGQSQTHYIDDKHEVKNPYNVWVAIKNPERCRRNN